MGFKNFLSQNLNLNRLLESLAWKLLPYAKMELVTPHKLRVKVRNKGDWACLSEVFLSRCYDPFFEHLGDVSCWVDLGCNAGLFSLGLLEHLRSQGRLTGDTRAVLCDANEDCVQLARETLSENPACRSWRCAHAVLGPRDTEVIFSQFKFSVHSSIFSEQKGEKVFRYRTADPESLLNGLRGPFDLVKIDIEGAEKFLFSDYPSFLKRFRYGLCEWHAPEFDGGQLREKISEHGFELIEVRSQPVNYDLSQGHSFRSPIGMVLWRNPSVEGVE